MQGKGNKEKTMIIYPAIDLIDGAVVRLHKGDFAQKTTYGSNPIGGGVWLSRGRGELAASG